MGKMSNMSADIFRTLLHSGAMVNRSLGASFCIVRNANDATTAVFGCWSDSSVNWPTHRSIDKCLLAVVEFSNRQDVN